MKIKFFGAILSICLILIYTSTFYFYSGYVQDFEKKPDKSIFYYILNLNNQIYDAFFHSKKHINKDSHAFLIAVDEESVQEIGRWPWPREIIAKITDNAIQAGAKSVAFDMIFSESESIQADKKLENIFTKNNDKIILGTFSDSKLASYSEPYQDYCYNEAFLKNGGESLVKLKFDLVVDDDNIQYEDVNLKSPFAKIFDLIERETDFYYLEKYNKKNISDLNQYQLNNLKTDKIKRIYGYCQNWLTENDHYYKQHAITLASDYHKSFAALSSSDHLDLEKKISFFKSSINKLLIPQFLVWTPNIKELQDSLNNTASFVVDYENDGVIRKYPLVYRTGNKLGSSYIPSLALQSYLTAHGYQAYFKLKTVKNEKFVESVIIKDVSSDKEKIIQTLPVDRHGRLIINYNGPKQSLPYVSARELFHDELKDITVHFRDGDINIKKTDFLKNKMAIFGATATGINDIRNTPVDAVLPGPEIHLSVLDSLDQQNFMTTANNEIKYFLLALILMVVVYSLFFLWTNLSSASLILLVFNYSLYLFSKYLFTKGLYLEYLSYFIICNLMTYLAYVIYIYFFETRKSQQIKNTFSKYVSKEIVNEILKNQDNLQLKGQKLNMTVYFSDIRSFTDFSEKMDPQELSTMLNRYFTPMSKIIFDENGTIDKFMGDAIMALFGAPINYPDHAEKACRAAIKCVKQLNEINVEFKKRNWPEIKIGIGLNTGTMVAGNIGSDQIQSYTVIGDEVNLASRLEGLTKNYGATVLISESTYEVVKDKFVIQQADIVRVKGKKKPVKIYSLIDEKNEKTDIDVYKKFDAAIDLYQNKKFNESLAMLKNLQKELSDNFLIQMYIERAQSMINQPPPENWDGVFDYKTK